jgi:hypothetical protein
MTKLFVVLAENGEYSDRIVWVAGVFPTESDARSEVEKHLAQRREYDQWNVKYQNTLQTFEEFRCNRYGTPHYTKNDHSKAAELAGPKPEYEGAERCEVIETELGKWI